MPTELTRRLATGGEGLSVLIVRLGAFGDVVRTVPAMRLLRRALPRAALYWVVESPWDQALQGHADLTDVIAMPRRRWDASLRSPWQWHRLARQFMTFRRRLRRLRVQLTLDFHGNLRSGLIARSSGAPVRLGYAGHDQKEGNRWLTTHQIGEGPRRRSRIERSLDLVRALGLPVDSPPSCELPLVERGRAAAQLLLRDLRPGHDGFATISPGSSAAQAFKRPPMTLLEATVSTLARRGVSPLVVWGPGEEDAARAVVRASAGAAYLAPATDLATLAALLRSARLFVGGDSGPMHLACAVGCPVLAMYGPTDPVVNQPWGVPFRAIAPPERHYTGIQRIDRRHGFSGLSAQQVERAVVALLQETPERREFCGGGASIG